MPTEEKEDINDRTRFIVEKFCEGNLAKFCRQTELHYSTANNVMRDVNKPGHEFIKRVIESFEVDIEWYVMGAGTYEKKKAVADTDEVQGLKRRVSNLETEIAIIKAAFVNKGY